MAGQRPLLMLQLTHTDTIVERDETVIVTITASNNPDVVIGSTNVATITITDNDDADVTLPQLPIFRKIPRMGLLNSLRPMPLMKP